MTSLNVTSQISPAYVPLPRSSNASPSVSISSPHGSIPSIRTDLMTIPSERPQSKRWSSERPSVIITDDSNHLLQYLHGLEGDRQRDNQGDVLQAKPGVNDYMELLVKETVTLHKRSMNPPATNHVARQEYIVLIPVPSHRSMRLPSRTFTQDPQLSSTLPAQD